MRGKRNHAIEFLQKRSDPYSLECLGALLGGLARFGFGLLDVTDDALVFLEIVLFELDGVVLVGLNRAAERVDEVVRERFGLTVRVSRLAAQKPYHRCTAGLNRAQAGRDLVDAHSEIGRGAAGGRAGPLAHNVDGLNEPVGRLNENWHRVISSEEQHTGLRTLERSLVLFSCLDHGLPDDLVVLEVLLCPVLFFRRA